MAEFVMPSLGADMEAGTLVAWLRKPGDSVNRGDIIAEVDTDKGVIEVEVYTSGVVDELLVEPGARVPVGTPLAIIREPGEAAAPSPEPAPAPPPAPAAGEARASPAARRLARELGVALESVSGTGPGGAVTREDVVAASERGPALDTGARMRRAIAAAMERSNREIPHYYVADTFEVSAAQAFLERNNAERPPPERWLFGVLLIKAVALALRQFPELNGRWENGRAIQAPDVNVGVAISLREGGLVIPAIRGTDQLGLDELMQRFRDLVARARGGALKSSELAEGTVTLTSLGERGVDAVYGVIYPPQVALVGFGRLAERPWVKQGQVVALPVVTATLAADHRVSDGHRGSLFLAALRQLLDQPEKLR